MSIVLASTSEIRRKLLRAAGVKFTVQSSGIDEAVIKSQVNLTPDRLAARLAEAKAENVSKHQCGSVVIGADQVLALGNVIFDKPLNGTEARNHLQKLRGKTHSLHSAAACASAGEIIWTYNDTARLTMRAFSDAWLDRYIAKGGRNIISSVGAYKIEGTGLQLFEKIDGDYFTILGLPLLPLLGFLRERGELQP